MMEWCNVTIGMSDLLCSDKEYILIQMPANTQYSGYAFWHLKKLIRIIDQNQLSLRFTTKFNFKLYRYALGSYEKDKQLDAIELTAAELIKAYATQEVHSC